MALTELPITKLDARDAACDGIKAELEKEGHSVLIAWSNQLGLIYADGGRPALHRGGPHAMTDEPHGHRGHPTSGEQFRARGTAARLGATIATLQDHGFTYDEAVAFIGGVCVEVGRDRGLEMWSLRGNAMVTLKNVLSGGAAKGWSLDVIDIALGTIADLLREE